MNPFIEARSIALVFKSKDRDPVTALNNFNIKVGKGEFVSIVGPSGCGKSTFLSMLLGLIKPGSGEMRIIMVHPLPGQVRNAPWFSRSLACFLAKAELGYTPKFSVKQALQDYMDELRNNGAGS